jgi:mannose-6-phosphate isomerase-like protein (cupin superfamily)
MNAQVFTLTDIVARHNERAGTLFYEFFRVPNLSAGLYRLAAGATDPQQPHGEDEVYFVLHGHATLQVETDNVVVGPGSIAHIPARVPHRFHTITEALEVLVVFAPAETAAC